MKNELIKYLWDSVVSDFVLRYIIENDFSDKCRILKTDLWNETVKKNERDVVLRLKKNKLSIKYSGIVVVEKSKAVVKMFLKRQRNYNGIKIIVGDISNLPLKSKTINVIIDFSTSDHLSNKEFIDALREYSRILSISGVLILVHYNSHYILDFFVEGFVNKIYSKHYIKTSRLSKKENFHFRRSLRYLINASHNSGFHLHDLVFLPFLITDAIPGFMICLLNTFIEILDVRRSFKRFVFKNCLNNRLFSMFTVLYLVKKR